MIEVKGTAQYMPHLRLIIFLRKNSQLGGGNYIYQLMVTPYTKSP